MRDDRSEDGRESLMDRLMNAPALEQLRFLQAIKDQGPDLRGEAVADLEAEGWTRYRIAQELGISRQAVNQWR